MNTKKLGFGLMRLPLNDPANAGDVDLEQVKQMVDRFLEKGFSYFDTAWMYCGFNSESTARAALVDRYPRDRFTLATKLHHAFFHSLEDRDKILNSQLEKTGVGYFDYYMLHGVEEGNLVKYEQFHCFEWMKERKAQGLMKSIGISFHSTGALLDQILTRYPFLDFVQLQVNYLDWESQWIQSKLCYETAVKHGKPIIIMEPAKGGTLAKVPDTVEQLFREQDPNASPASWAIRFAAGLPHVMMVLSGMSSLSQMEDNLSYMEHFQPLNEAEQALVRKAAELINAQTAVPCTGCSYCTDGCPQKIAIPQYFSIYNENMRDLLEEKGWTANTANYNNLTLKFGKASDCIACGRCEAMCPQHLPIIEHLKTVAEHFGK